MRCEACWGYIESIFDNCPKTKVRFCDDCRKYMGLINKGKLVIVPHDSHR